MGTHSCPAALQLPSSPPRGLTELPLTELPLTRGGDICGTYTQKRPQADLQYPGRNTRGEAAASAGTRLCLAPPSEGASPLSALRAAAARGQRCAAGAGPAPPEEPGQRRRRKPGLFTQNRSSAGQQNTARWLRSHPSRGIRNGCHGAQGAFAVALSLPRRRGKSPTRGAAVTHGRIYVRGEYPWGNTSCKCLILRLSNWYVFGIYCPCKLGGFGAFVKRPCGEPDLLSVSRRINVLSVISEPINASSKALAELATRQRFCSAHSEPRKCAILP